MNSYERGSGQGAGAAQSIAGAISEVSERAMQLVHEEIELAKAEVSEKASGIVRGAVVGAAAGIFGFFALIMVLFGLAFLAYWYLPVNTGEYFWGFFVVAGGLLLLGALAGALAFRAIRRSTPPVPEMALEEARKIRESVTVGPTTAPGATASGSIPGWDPVLPAEPLPDAVTTAPVGEGV